MVTEKNEWLKTNESKTETEHNGDWKMHEIKPMNEKQKQNQMVTEIMHAKKPMNAKKYNYCKHKSHPQILLNAHLMLLLLNHYHQIHEYEFASQFSYDSFTKSPNVNVNWMQA